MCVCAVGGTYNSLFVLLSWQSVYTQPGSVNKNTCFTGFLNNYFAPLCCTNPVFVQFAICIAAVRQLGIPQEWAKCAVCYRLHVPRGIWLVLWSSVL